MPRFKRDQRERQPVMIRRSRVFVLFFLFLGAISFAEVRAEEVKYVIDGDTVVLTSEVRVRLIGIDAPEVDHSDYGLKGEPYGVEATEYLRALIGSKPVRLESGSEPQDKYGRTLAYLFLPDGVFVNQKMVEAGFAETYRRFDFKYKQQFLELEKKARSRKLGMWQDRPDDWKNQFIHWLSSRNSHKAKSGLTDK
jgi:micrococcal nuclease